MDNIGSYSRYILSATLLGTGSTRVIFNIGENHYSGNRFTGFTDIALSLGNLYLNEASDLWHYHSKKYPDMKNTMFKIFT